MSDPQHNQGDAESLARKLHALESRLTAGERTLLKNILGAAALSGMIGVAGAAGVATLAELVHSGMFAAETGAAAPEQADMDSIRAQFLDAFVPGEAWETPPTISIKPPH